MYSDRFDEEALSVSTLEHVEKLCQEFISQFRAGDAPRIEILIDQQPPAVRPAALFYLIKEERELRSGDGRPPSLEEFVDRFPKDREIVELAWGEASDFEVELEVIIGPHRGRCFTFRRHDMDYVPGSDGAQIVKYQGPMGIGRAVRLVTQALNALAFAHRQGYVHRDVKPSNLLISGKEPQETCRLADFGLARVYYESRMSGLTLLGTAGGTLQFMAPEQVTNFRGVGPAADQYGAAATLYHLCTGQHLFPNDDDQDRRLMNILETEPIPIQQQRPEIPNGLARIIHKALTKDADDRFLDVGTFRAALMAYASV